MSLRARDVAAAFKWACLTELDAPKPGNVHVFAGGHNMTAAEFVDSAEAAAPPLAKKGAGVGARIHDAVEATFARVGANTNLGIILLCAPLAAAAGRAVIRGKLRKVLGEVLADLDIEDAAWAFRGIARANPGGIGRVKRHDVFAPAEVDLRVAMVEAAGRDRVARQYATDFADVFDLGLPAVKAAMRSGKEAKWAALAAYLSFLAAFPDSHIARKHGRRAAGAVRRKAVRMLGKLRVAAHPVVLLPDLLAWDRVLKETGVNPGTSADLTVATLFAYRLQTILPKTRNSD